jgi:hypothetical protein
LSARELAALQRVELSSFAKGADDQQEKMTLKPLLFEDNGRRRLFYAPWLLRDSYDEEATKALNTFVRYLKGKRYNEFIYD